MNIPNFTPKQKIVPVGFAFPTISDRRTQIAIMEALKQSGSLFKFASNPSETHCELFRMQTSNGRALAGLVIAQPVDDVPTPWKPGHTMAGQIVIVRPLQDIADTELLEILDAGMLDGDSYADCVRLKADPFSRIDGWEYDTGDPVKPDSLAGGMNFTPKQ